MNSSNEPLYKGVHKIRHFACEKKNKQSVIFYGHLGKQPELNIKLQAYNSSNSVEIKTGKYGRSVFSKNDAKAGFQNTASEMAISANQRASYHPKTLLSKIQLWSP